MSLINFFDPRKTIKLYGLIDEFKFLKDLILEDKFPRVLLLTGEKGIGKFTLINHLMHFYFNKVNYDLKNNLIKSENVFFKQLLDGVNSNVTILQGSSFNNIKIENIRLLKENLTKTSMNNDKKFIILDDVETFNANSLNALLKIIEEPSNKIHFILINNKIKPLLNTIRSRSIEMKIILSQDKLSKTIISLLKTFNQNLYFDEKLIKASPGNFLKFNHLIEKHNIDLNENFMNNLILFLNLFKKEKNIFYKQFLIYFSEYHFKKLLNENLFTYEKFIEKRSYIIEKLNEYFLYNLSQKSLINSLEGKLINE